MNIAVTPELRQLLSLPLPPWATTVKDHFFPAGATRVLVYSTPVTVEVNGEQHTALNA
jgi:hypothetical protein